MGGESLEPTSSGTVMGRLEDLALCGLRLIEIHKCVEYKFEHILDGQWVNVKVSDPNRADGGKNASRAVEIAAIAAGVEPSKYLDYLTELGQQKYGYVRTAEIEKKDS